MTAARPTILQAAIEAGITNAPGRSRQHGEQHWMHVAATGVWLGRWMQREYRSATDQIDLEFIATFAMLHDTMRLNDGKDPEHGHRAADFFERMFWEDRLGREWTETRRYHMAYALEHHNDQTPLQPHTTQANVNIGICWDADRLNLVRIDGRRIDDRYLSSWVAKTRDAKRYAQRLCAGRGRGSATTWQSALRYPGAEALWA